MTSNRGKNTEIDGEVFCDEATMKGGVAEGPNRPADFGVCHRLRAACEKRIDSKFPLKNLQKIRHGQEQQP